jgi:hypothetical protein
VAGHQYLYVYVIKRLDQSLRRTRPPRCRSCRGARTIRFSAVPISSRNEVNRLGNCLSRSIHREMAAEWLQLADAVLRPSKSGQ